MTNIKDELNLTITSYDPTGSMCAEDAFGNTYKVELIVSNLLQTQDANARKEQPGEKPFPECHHGQGLQRSAPSRLARILEEIHSEDDELSPPLLEDEIFPEVHPFSHPTSILWKKSANKGPDAFLPHHMSFSGRAIPRIVFFLIFSVGWICALSGYWFFGPAFTLIVLILTLIQFDNYLSPGRSYFSSQKRAINQKWREEEISNTQKDDAQKRIKEARKKHHKVWKKFLYENVIFFQFLITTILFVSLYISKLIVF
jgi:hypothetical protein